ncbi:MAG TPA: transcriptional regulator [Thermodesulfovibrionia bacterium]|nr:transcriptional regulator [Thermodesulfovibrionia bacterium]
MKIRPVRSEKDYKQVIERIDELIDSKLGTKEFDELEILSILAENYEEKHYNIDFPDPVEAIKHIMEWKGLKEEDLEPYIGTKIKVLEILNRKSGLTLEIITKLKNGLGISADILIPDDSERITQQASTKKVSSSKFKA